MVSLRIFRSVAAWALPRPSATASAKLANRTVNHSHSVTDPVNHSGSIGDAKDRSRIHSAVVATLPISTTNMTGILVHVRRRQLNDAVDGGTRHDLAVKQGNGFGSWPTHIVFSW